MEQKKCSRCGESKAQGDWYAAAWAASGGWCKECYCAWHRGRYIPKAGGNDDPRECAQCGTTYQPKTRRPSLYCSRECKAQQRKESGQERDQHLRRKYGISAADYDRILAEQGGGCALCGVKPEELTAGRYRTYLHVDHCHDTGRIRGLLCPEHNLMLGRFGDQPEMFRTILKYLEADASN